MRLYCYWVLHQVDLVDLVDLVDPVAVANKGWSELRPDLVRRRVDLYWLRR